MTTKTDAQERAAFEAWYVTQTTEDYDWWGWEEEHGQYEATHSRLSWAAWQARAAVEADRQDHVENDLAMVPSDADLLGCAGVTRNGGLPSIIGTADIRRFADCVRKHFGGQPAASAEPSTNILKKLDVWLDETAASVAQESVGVVCKAGPMYAPDTTMALFFAGEVPVGTKLYAASVAPHVCVAMPTLNDAMRAVLRNEHDVYATPEELYTALCKAAGLRSSTPDQEDDPVTFAKAEIARRTRDRDDAERYRLLRRGQHWSVIDGAGNTLRAETLDSAIDAARAAKGADHD